jgi:hypothetical protein
MRGRGVSAGDGVVVQSRGLGQHRGEQSGEACQELHYSTLPGKPGPDETTSAWLELWPSSHLGHGRRCQAGPVAVLPSVVL